MKMQTAPQRLHGVFFSPRSKDKTQCLPGGTMGEISEFFNFSEAAK
jgi:hypothetical protein